MQTINKKWFARSGAEYVGPVEQATEHRAMVPSKLVNCYRCGGMGGSDAWQHTGWTCYQCGGARKIMGKPYPVYSAEKLAKLEAAQEKRNAKKRAEIDAKIAAREKRDAEEFAQWSKTADAKRAIEIASAHAYENEFACNMLDKINTQRPLTERMVAALFSIQERAEKNARVQFAGEIGKPVTIKGVAHCVSHWEGVYGFGCIVIIESGDHVFKYKGSGSQLLRYDRDTGRYIDKPVEFIATVKDHDRYNDTNVTVIQRPRKFAETCTA